MGQLSFSKLTIDLTASVTGIVGLCFPVLLGWLSDRVGRRKVMVAAFVLTGVSLVVLAFARVPWQFFLYAGLFAFIGVPFGIGPAYVMDLVPRENAAGAVSFFQTSFWVGNILGMAAVGFAFEHLGMFVPLLGSSLFAGAGIVLLLLIRARPSPATI
jgi:DHA1 family inner membrane transport protein